jgi:hypothetical protein
MSDTRRHVDKEKGWTLGNPTFDKWNESRPEKQKVKSLKHQERDRNRPSKLHGGKKGRFVNGTKNCLYNLKNKADNMKLKENLEKEDK